MKPSVGRIVHYTGFGDEQKGECYTAIVARVHTTYVMPSGDDGARVDLTVFPPLPSGISPSAPDAASHAPSRYEPDVTGGGNAPGQGQWHWPERVAD